MMGSTLRGMTRMMAFCAAARSDSTAAASPFWPSPACSVAMSSQGQRRASCSWGPALMLPAAAAGSGHTYRSGTRPQPAAELRRSAKLVGFPGARSRRRGGGRRRRAGPALLSGQPRRLSPSPRLFLAATCSKAAGSSKAYFKQTDTQNIPDYESFLQQINPERSAKQVARKKSVRRGRNSGSVRNSSAPQKRGRGRSPHGHRVLVSPAQALG